MTNLLLRNVRPHGGAASDLLIRDGRIAGIGHFEPEAGMPVEDGGGAIAIPGLIDAHTHLDKTTWGMPWHENNRRAVLRERIDFERANRIAIRIAPHRQSMRHAIGLAAHGATHIRSHVDIDTEIGLAAMAVESRGQSVPIGSFLNPDDRESFATACSRALARARAR